MTTDQDLADRFAEIKKAVNKNGESIEWIIVSVRSYAIIRHITEEEALAYLEKHGEPAGPGMWMLRRRK